MHRIRLAGPWQIPDHVDKQDSWTNVSLPLTHAATGSEGRLRIRRKFHSPTGIDSATPLRICITGERIDGVSLNGELLPAGSTTAFVDSDAISFDVTGRLKSFNELEVWLLPNPSQPAELRSAELHIDPTN